MELAVLERLKIPDTFIMGKILCHISAFSFEWIFFILADKKATYKCFDEFEFL